MSDTQSRLTNALADRYRVERELGAGGMATVFLAHDLKHEREVAIKVLHPDLGAALGSERFLAEIKTTARLQHPHVLPLLDSGEADGLLFYVMPFVRGETLRARLQREQQLPVDVALRLAREAADALHYAHGLGIVHRDIKPENILLQDDHALVADFGIALAVQSAGGERMTHTGLSLGTPQYMSPEQARGERKVDARADVYALGAVTYEMLTGEPPFPGASVQAILSKVMHSDPEPISTLRKTVPPAVMDTVHAALHKLPADRPATARAFAEGLVDIGASGFRTGAVPSYREAPSQRRWRALAIAASVVAVIAIASALVFRQSSPLNTLTQRFDLAFGDLQPAASGDVIIAPDGRTIVMAATGPEGLALYARRLDGEAEFRKIPGTEDGSSPAFSPDGTWIAFRRGSDMDLVKIRLDGSGATRLAPKQQVMAGFIHWGTPEHLIVGGPNGRFLVSANGGAVRPLPKLIGRYLHLLPDGKSVLASGLRDNVSLYDVEGDSSYVLLENAAIPTYVQAGYLTFLALDGGLMAQRFDPASRTLSGNPRRIAERVGANWTGRGFSVASNGTLVLNDAFSTIRSENLFVLVDPSTRRVDTLRTPRALKGFPVFSPDGRKLLFEVYDPERAGDTDLYAFDLLTGTASQLTHDADNDRGVWSPDGTMIAFDRGMGTAPKEIYLKPADNSAPERQLTNLGSGDIVLQQWLRDGRLLFTAPTGTTDILWLTSVTKGGAVSPYLPSAAGPQNGVVSPDGRYMAYHSFESGRREIWIREFPTPNARWNVSQGQGGYPRWSPDGKAVFFTRIGAPEDSVMMTPVERTGRSLSVGAPRLVYTLDFDGIGNWDLHPDGRRFVAAITSRSTSKAQGPARYLIVQNWFAELRSRMNQE